MGHEAAMDEYCGTGKVDLSFDPQNRSSWIHISFGLNVHRTVVIPIILLPIPFQAARLDMGTGSPVEAIRLVPEWIGPSVCTAA
jgi:hypothetical protein